MGSFATLQFSVLISILNRSWSGTGAGVPAPVLEWNGGWPITCKIGGAPCCGSFRVATHARADCSFTNMPRMSGLKNRLCAFSMHYNFAQDYQAQQAQ